MSIIGNFSERLRAVRENRSWSQAKLADFLGVSTGTVGNWETGASSPGFEELDRIAEKLQEPAAYLFGFSSSSLAAEKIGVLRDQQVASSPWPHLSDDTLRRAMAELTQSEADEAMEHLAVVVGEVRNRSLRKRVSGGGLLPCAPERGFHFLTEPLPWLDPFGLGGRTLLVSLRPQS